MGAFAWPFLLRKVLSGLPGLAPPCCAVRARGVGLASVLAVPASRGFGVVVEVLQQCSCGCCGWDGPSSIPARRGAGPSPAVPQ